MKEQTKIPTLKLQITLVSKESRKPNPVKSVECIKCYSSSGPRPTKHLSNSIRHNCLKVCKISQRKRLKTILKITEKATFFKVINKPTINTTF